MILLVTIAFLLLVRTNHHNTLNPERVVYETCAHVVFSNTIPAGLVAQRISNLRESSIPATIILFDPLL